MWGEGGGSEYKSGVTNLCSFWQYAIRVLLNDYTQFSPPSYLGWGIAATLHCNIPAIGNNVTRFLQVVYQTGGKVLVFFIVIEKSSLFYSVF